MFGYKMYIQNSDGSRIFLKGEAPTPKVGLFFQLFAENCMKMKEFGPRGASLVPPLDPPMQNALWTFAVSLRYLLFSVERYIKDTVESH